MRRSYHQPGDPVYCIEDYWIFAFLGIHSSLQVQFKLQRHMGNFVIQVYGPCVLLVVISWVSFWLNREATSDRISLGLETVQDFFLELHRPR